MNIHNLFPIPIGIFDLNRKITKREHSFISKLDKKTNMGNLTSVDNKILKNSQLKSLGNWFKESLHEYFIATVNPKNEVSIKITQSWINYTEPRQYHHKHNHPNSFISGVFYTQTNANDKIYFYNDKYRQIDIPAKEWNIWNSESWWYEAIQGRLILFPSSLTHMVPTVDGEFTRISLSFNTFPSGILGEEINLTGLQLKIYDNNESEESLDCEQNI